jgi:hypothetical protein
VTTRVQRPRRVCTATASGKFLAPKAPVGNTDRRAHYALYVAETWIPSICSVLESTGLHGPGRACGIVNRGLMPGKYRAGYLFPSRSSPQTTRSSTSTMASMNVLAEERIQAVSQFLLQSPPGEINDVLNGTVDPFDAQVTHGVEIPTLEQTYAYSSEMMRVWRRVSFRCYNGTILSN